MLKITIHSDTKPTAKAKGRLLEQTAWVHLPGAPFPKEISVSQWKDPETDKLPFPYPEGEYTFDTTSFFVDAKNYNRLSINPVLIPVRKTAVK